MEQYKWRTNAGVLLLSKFEFTPFRGKTIVVVGSYIPECNVMTRLYKLGTCIIENQLYKL